jgi:hypothetical protein
MGCDSGRAIRLLLGLMVFCCMHAARADTYNGKIDLVEAKADGTRFFVHADQLNLYATGQYVNVLLGGYFRKASFVIGYQPFPCPGGMKGKCGTVYSVTVEQTGF